MATSSFGMVLTTIAAGNWIDADMYFHKVTDQAGADQYALVDFANTTWPALLPGANNVGFSSTAPGTGCALDITWRDGWL
jgi:phage-related protein